MKVFRVIPICEICQKDDVQEVNIEISGRWTQVHLCEKDLDTSLRKLLDVGQSVAAKGRLRRSQGPVTYEEAQQRVRMAKEVGG